MTEITKIDLFTEDQGKFKSTDVKKLLQLNFDLGTLLAIDTNDLDVSKFNEDPDLYLKDLARDNTQLLLNEVWKLPTARVDEAIVANLPKPTFLLPREKPIPKPKPLSKWQQYMKDKGLRKTKKTNVTWDDVLKKWVPRYGYKKAAAEKEKNWVIEVPQNADPYEDMFKKKADEKKEKVSKNEFQRLRNIAKAKNIKVPRMGIPPKEKLSSLELNSAAAIADVSTASLGKFQPKLTAEKKMSKKSILQNKKQKTSHLSGEDEHKKYMSIADKILNKNPKIDLEKAVNKEIHSQEVQSSENKKSRKKSKNDRSGGKPKGGKKTQGGKNKGSSFKGSTKHKTFGKGPSGRKRR